MSEEQNPPFGSFIAKLNKPTHGEPSDLEQAMTEKKLSERVRNCAYIVPDPHPAEAWDGVDCLAQKMREA